jgi:hypothetical protein
VPAADEKIVFDKFHIAQSLNQAVDQVRRSEQRRLGAEGDTSLKWTRFDWLRHPGSFTRAARRAFDDLRDRSRMRQHSAFGASIPEGACGDRRLQFLVCQEITSAGDQPSLMPIVPRELSFAGDEEES